MHIPIVKCDYHFLHFVWQNKPYEEKVLPFGMATFLGIFISHPQCILFLCQWKGFHIIIYLDGILDVIYFEFVGKRAHTFICSLLVHLGLHISFLKSEFCLTQHFCF